MVLGERIDGAENEVADLKWHSVVLPAVWVRLNVGPGVDLEDSAPCRIDLEGAGGDVAFNEGYGPVQIRLVAEVGVKQDKVLNAQVRELRGGMRPAAAESGD